jgi:hypothetical protein
VKRQIALAGAAICLLSLGPCAGQRIRVLLTGQIAESVNPLQSWFLVEPLVDHVSVPSRDLTGTEGGDVAMRRFIRLYFPRTFEEVRSFDFFLLNSPILYFFRSADIQWMYDAITEGSAGLNTASVMSQNSDIYGPWASSVLQEAFPNDAPAVVQRWGGATGDVSLFRIRVNGDFPEPVLTPFIPLGIETYRGHDSRAIILRQGASPMAWQIGNHPRLGDVPFIAAWEFEKGRTLTTGDAFGHTFWSSYRGGRDTDNRYALDILMNLIFWATQRGVQTDVLLYHGMRSSFLTYRERMGLLVSLMDFVEKFGASSRQIEEMIDDLDDLSAEAREAYLGQDFELVESTMDEAHGAFKEAEVAAMKLKDRALLWVYVIEWMAVCGVSLIAGFAVFTLMVKRRLYREVQVTRQDQR